MGVLDGRIAFVTGAAHGIGRAIAQRFAAEGASVVIFDIDGEAAAKSAAAIGDHGGIAQSVTGDISSEGDVEAAIAHVLTTYGRIDVACNDAAVMDALTPLHHSTLEHWERVMRVNATGTYVVCRALIEPMLEAGSGTIVNIASIAGIAGGRAGVAYTASKHAVVGLTRNIAFTYADRGIRCNAICPGGVATGIALRDGKRDEYGQARYRLSAPSKPPNALPEQLAAVATFLASDESSYMNGAIVTADGGWTAA